MQVEWIFYKSWFFDLNGSDYFCLLLPSVYDDKRLIWLQFFKCTESQIFLSAVKMHNWLSR